ncbi:MAG: hypothetical protein SGCHY_001101, partial [Lobulomycetales sp.]
MQATVLRVKRPREEEAVPLFVVDGNSNKQKRVRLVASVSVKAALKLPLPPVPASASDNLRIQHKLTDKL